MEKRLTTNQIGNAKDLRTDYNFGDKRTEIDEIINFLIDAKQDGATHIEFDGVTEYESNTVLEELTIITVKVTEESDEDFQKRIEARKMSRKKDLLLTEKLELQELERLKKKYE